jgi:hypothetical protein
LLPPALPIGAYLSVHNASSTASTPPACQLDETLDTYPSSHPPIYVDQVVANRSAAPCFGCSINNFSPSRRDPQRSPVDSCALIGCLLRRRKRRSTNGQCPGQSPSQQQGDELVHDRALRIHYVGSWVGGHWKNEFASAVSFATVHRKSSPSHLFSVTLRALTSCLSLLNYTFAFPALIYTTRTILPSPPSCTGSPVLLPTSPHSNLRSCVPTNANSFRVTTHPAVSQASRGTLLYLTHDRQTQRLLRHPTTTVTHPVVLRFTRSPSPRNTPHR